MLTWNPELRIGDIVAAVGFIVTIVSLWFAGRQLQQARLEQIENTRVQRANFLLEIMRRYFDDTDLLKFYYMLDYHDFHLDFEEVEGSGQYPTQVRYESGRPEPHDFFRSQEELWLDNLIYQFDLIGHMVRMGVITPEEVSVIAFRASRVLENPSVRRYLDWLDREYSRLGRPTPAHADARYLVEVISRTKTAHVA